MIIQNGLVSFLGLKGKMKFEIKIKRSKYKLGKIIFFQPKSTTQKLFDLFKLVILSCLALENVNNCSQKNVNNCSQKNVTMSIKSKM
ncbi:hypothetical protein BpHYR1_014089 [Brachionus plicatilis]|uniref:Uncharacterized protein n=1 Tax=Brachionus plicatilis TaxID=10195 RepID=A0A3M7RDV0_BRAPC|nr:hypothetical protein BpHYR1_014089 [Brachionus plicatilis]